jgi:molecular chaperone HscB
MWLRGKLPGLKQDFFSLLGLPLQFELDSTALEQAYRQVQQQVHPDKFATASDVEKRVAMQWATRANEAYQTLKSPLKRARYLCELQGIDLQLESNTAMPAAFLMQQMAWREQLEQANGQAASLNQLALDLQAARQQLQTEVASLLAQANYLATAEKLRQWMFLDKLASEVVDAQALTD